MAARKATALDGKGGEAYDLDRPFRVGRPFRKPGRNIGVSVRQRRRWGVHSASRFRKDFQRGKEDNSSPGREVTALYRKERETQQPQLMILKRLLYDVSTKAGKGGEVRFAGEGAIRLHEVQTEKLEKKAHLKGETPTKKERGKGNECTARSCWRTIALRRHLPGKGSWKKEDGSYVQNASSMSVVVGKKGENLR